jgi:hypothetical protein
MWGMALYSPLAIDPGELAWFLSVRREYSFVDTQDAERALNFVFWWLIAFEASPAQERVDRYTRWHLARRRMRVENGPAFVEKADWRSLSDRRGELTLKISNVPDPEVFGIWRKAVQDLVHVERGKFGFSINESGDATISVRDPEVLGHEIERLKNALISAEDVLSVELEERTRKNAEAARAAREREQDREAFAVALAEASLPSWIRDLRAEPDPRSHSSSTPANRLVLEVNTTESLASTIVSMLRDGGIDARRDNYSAEELILPFQAEPAAVLSSLSPHHERIQKLIDASRTWGEVPLAMVVADKLREAGISIAFD